MATTLSAASRLRNKCLEVPNTILLYSAGEVDKVIRVIPLESCVLNLDRGPDQEKWEDIKGIINSEARRDRPVPRPLPVSQKTSEEWSLLPEDIPVIELPNLIKAEEDKKAAELKAEESKSPVTTPVISPPLSIREEATITLTKEEVKVVEKSLKENSSFRCPECSKPFKNAAGMKIHSGNMHKKKVKV